MNKLKEKASYIRGLMEGLEFDENKKETKLFDAIIDLLDDIAGGVCNLDQDINDICEEMDAIDEDIKNLEDELCQDGTCECKDDCHCEEDCNCGCSENKDEDIFYEVTCPTCNQKMRLDEKTLVEEKTNCLNCGELLEFDFGENCNCDCQEKD